MGDGLDLSKEETEVLVLLLAEPNLHLTSLQYFADEATRHYNKLLGLSNGEILSKENIALYERMQSFSLGAIIGGVSFLETQINDFFGKCNDLDGDDSGLLEGTLLTSTELKVIRAVCKFPNFERISTLDKYSEALRLADRNGFDKGGRVYHETKELIDFRNSLIHFQHYTAPSRLKTARKITTFLETKKIRPLVIGEFPYSYLTGPTAQWASVAAIQFFTQFCKLLHAGSPEDKKLRGMSAN
jgi:hypothetical protein